MQVSISKWASKWANLGKDRTLSLCLKELSFEFVRSFAHSLAHALAFVLAFAFSFAQVCCFQIAHNYLSLCTKFRRLAHKMHALCRACENNEMRSDVEQWKCECKCIRETQRERERITSRDTDCCASERRSKSSATSLVSRQRQRSSTFLTPFASNLAGFVNYMSGPFIVLLTILQQTFLPIRLLLQQTISLSFSHSLSQSHALSLSLYKYNSLSLAYFYEPNLLQKHVCMMICELRCNSSLIFPNELKTCLNFGKSIS